MKRLPTHRFAALLTLLCLALSSSAALALDPPPDGGYPSQNTAEGEDALFNLGDGFSNTGVGFEALYNNATGFLNTALGASALLGNTAGFYNTALGTSALRSNTTGTNNTASGLFALYSNTGADNNTADGVAALFANTTGNHNSAVGSLALQGNSTGNGNTAIGYLALSRSSEGDGNIALGQFAGSHLTGGHNIDIGHEGEPNESRTIRIGTTPSHANTYIAGINGVTVAGGVGVVVDGNGHLGTITSSARYKDNIQPMDKASEAVLALKPVTFRYKKELDPAAIPQFGLVAEEVAKVDPDLVARDEEGKPYTVRYEAVNAMLLNEFLKAHRQLDEQRDEIDSLKASMTKLQTTLEKMSAEGE